MIWLWQDLETGEEYTFTSVSLAIDVAHFTIGGTSYNQTRDGLAFTRPDGSERITIRRIPADLAKRMTLPAPLA